MKEAKDHWHTTVNAQIAKKRIFSFEGKIFLSANIQGCVLSSVTTHSFYRKATRSSSTSMTKMLYEAAPQKNWLIKPLCQSPAISRFPSLCRADLLILCEFSPSLSSCFNAGAWRQSRRQCSLLVSSQPNSSELLGTAVRVELGVHSVPGSWQMLQPSFNPKAAGYIFHWKIVILRKSIRGNTEERFLTQF